MKPIALLSWLSLMICCSIFSSAWADPPAGKEQRRPTEFARIFNLGYVRPAMPADAASFDKLMKLVKAANYNVVLCPYSDERAEICRKHGLKIFVDMLVAENHIFQNPEGAKALCQKLRTSNDIYGYLLWTDNIATRAAGRNRDIANVHTWDDRHTAYVGTYRDYGLGQLENADAVGYYDFHWQRGGQFKHLNAAMAAATKNDCVFLSYLAGNVSDPGEGNRNFVRYTINTAIAAGLRGYLFHNTGTYIDLKELKWLPLGEDVAAINAQVAPLGPELMKIGRPVALYATPTARDPGNKAKPLGIPEHLTAIPKDNWLQVDQGEALLGFYKDKAGADVVYIANLNAQAWQGMILSLAGDAKKAKAWQFDRPTAKWVAFEPGESFSFPLSPGDAEMFKFERGK
ncbi:MAG: hypothetical protein K8T91_22405 [Planctomycetes bacterium]|nr:hypothetical protein [Planctomycetota bacterium]